MQFRNYWVNTILFSFSAEFQTRSKTWWPLNLGQKAWPWSVLWKTLTTSTQCLTELFAVTFYPCFIFKNLNMLMFTSVYIPKEILAWSRAFFWSHFWCSGHFLLLDLSTCIYCEFLTSHLCARGLQRWVHWSPFATVHSSAAYCHSLPALIYSPASYRIDLHHCFSCAVRNFHFFTHLYSHSLPLYSSILL